jgi:hypothetical protein
MCRAAPAFTAYYLAVTAIKAGNLTANEPYCV